MELLQRSIAAGVLIACILILRGLAWKRLSKRVFLLLWKLAVLRLLLPFSFHAELAWLNRENYVISWQDMLSRIMSLRNMEVEAVIETKPAVLVWFLGMLLLALYFLRGYLRAYMLFREVIPVGNIDSIDTDSIKTGGILTGRVRIAMTDRISTPIVYGLFCPKIILPKTMELCLHWFNPFVYAMYYFLNRDMEIACDECVISAMNKKDRQRYAITLVVLAENASLSCLSGFGKSAVKDKRDHEL